MGGDLSADDETKDVPEAPNNEDDDQVVGDDDDNAKEKNLNEVESLVCY